MKRVILMFSGSLILFGLNACRDDGNAVPDKPLVDTEWDLQSFEIVGGEKSDVGSQGMILIFTEDGHVEGEAYRIYGDPDVPGNSYRGTYEVGPDDTLSIDIIGSTYVGLPPESRFDEYILALKNTSAYEIKGDKLRIFYDERTKALNFKGE
jgi:hypothetical protein